MRLSLLRWGFLAATLAIVAGDAKAEAPAYGYGAAAHAARPSFDLRRSAPPDQSVLADDEADESADVGDDETDVAETASDEAPAETRAPATGERQTLTAVRDESLSGLSGAHASLPIPSLVDVSANGRFALVRIERRGSDEDRLALSPRAAEALGVGPGTEAQVQVRYLGPAPTALAQGEAPGGPASLLPPGAAPPEPWTSVPARAVEAAPAPRAWAEAAPARGGYMVQVGAFAELTNAHRARLQLISAGDVRVEPRRVGGSELYRVRLGPWPDRARAELARRQVATLGFPDAIIAPR